MLFVEYPKCTTCQKARKWLERHTAAECGACESRCPFGVKIAERMAGAARVFQK